MEAKFTRVNLGRTISSLVYFLLQQLDCDLDLRNPYESGLAKMNSGVGIVHRGGAVM